MPVALAVFARALIQAVISSAILWVAEKYLFPLLNYAIKEVALHFGCTEEEATDIAANEVLRFVETGAVLLLTIRSKMPVKIAERLGFTTKGWNIRKLSPTLAAKVSKVAGVSTVTSVATVAEVETVAQTVASSKGLNVSLVSSLYKSIIGFVGVTTGVLFVVGNFIDFANWNGAYQGTFQKLFTIFGLQADNPLPKAKTISDDTWKKIYSTVEELSPETIAFPWLDEVHPYNRATLADAVDHFAANISLHGGQATFKTVWGLLLPCIKLKGVAGSGTGTGSFSGLGNIGLVVPQVQVFTGVLSQGYLGKGVEFSVRQDDMIENAKELIEAATNNIAPFLASVPGMITYQVKVVPSVTTKDGFTQKGSAVQVITRYDSKGLPVYKTIINKFAIVELSILTDKGTRVKFKTIILGPVDAVKFSVSTSTLSSVDSALKNLVSTDAIGDIKGLETMTPVTITTPKVTTQTPTVQITAPVGTVATNVSTSGEMYKFYVGRYGSPEKLLPSIVAGIPGFTEITESEFNRLTNQGAATPSSPAPSYTPVPPNYTPVPPNYTPVPPNYTPVPTTAKPGANASTLNEWYVANGRSLPGLQERSVLYQSYNLGSSSYYTGTAEQNARLLEKLKA